MSERKPEKAQMDLYAAKESNGVPLSGARIQCRSS